MISVYPAAAVIKWRQITGQGFNLIAVNGFKVGEKFFSFRMALITKD
jgi:hypothetical protein